MKMKFILALFIFDIAQVCSIELKCNITWQNFMEGNGKSNSLYACKVTEISSHISREDKKVQRCVKVSDGSDCYGKTQRALVAENLTILYFPRGLETTVGNLKLISIQSCRLQAIEEEDLKPFPDLMDIDLQSNEIEVLGINLFDHNKKLRMINLADNKISKIHPKIFHNLDHLQRVSLSYNPCADEVSLAYDKNPLEVKTKAIEFVNWCNWYTANNSSESKSSLQQNMISTESCQDIKSKMQQCNRESELKNNAKSFKNKYSEGTSNFLTNEIRTRGNEARNFGEKGPDPNTPLITTPTMTSTEIFSNYGLLNSISGNEANHKSSKSSDELSDWTSNTLNIVLIVGITQILLIFVIILSFIMFMRQKHKKEIKSFEKPEMNENQMTSNHYDVQYIKYGGFGPGSYKSPLADFSVEYQVAVDSKEKSQKFEEPDYEEVIYNESELI